MRDKPTDDLPDGVVSRTVNRFGVIRYWDSENRLHNPAGPAFIRPDKATYWLVTGIDPSGISDWWFHQRKWYDHGRLHRIGGPAIEYGDGAVEYWVNGELTTKAGSRSRFWRWVNHRKGQLS